MSSGFGQKGYARLAFEHVGELRLGIAGDEHHRRLAQIGPGGLEQGGAVDARHDDVGDHQIDPAILFLADVEGRLAVGGLQHLVTPRPQQPRRDAANERFVLDEEDPSGAGEVARRGSDRSDGRFEVEDGARLGKEDAEGRAAAGRGDVGNPAVGLFDRAIDGRQPKAGALADALGGEEGLEHVGGDGGGDARAIVGDFDQGKPRTGRTTVFERDGFVARQARAAQADRAAADPAHRVAGR